MYQFEANLYRTKTGVLKAEMPIMHVNLYFDPYNEESPSHEWNVHPCTITNERDCCTGFALVTVDENINPMDKAKDHYEGKAIMVKNRIPGIEETERLIKYLYGTSRTEVVVRKNTKMGDYIFLRLCKRNMQDYHEGYMIVQKTNGVISEDRGTFYPANLSDDTSGTTEIMPAGEYLLKEKTGKSVRDYLGNTILSHYEGTYQIEMRNFHDMENADILERSVERGIFEFHHCGNKRCIWVTMPNAERLTRLDDEFSEEEKTILLETVSKMNDLSNAYYDDMVKNNPNIKIGKSKYGLDLIETYQYDSIKIAKWLEEHNL